MSTLESKEFDRIKQQYLTQDDAKDLTFQNFLNLPEDVIVCLVRQVTNLNDKGILKGLWNRQKQGIYNYVV
jgi:hypothetical protein